LERLSESKGVSLQFYVGQTGKYNIPVVPCRLRELQCQVIDQGQLHAVSVEFFSACHKSVVQVPVVRGAVKLAFAIRSVFVDVTCNQNVSTTSAE
jgi:hypothetical protein